MKHIAIFCSAKEIGETYRIPAVQFAKLLPKNGYGLVWGGSDIGLMRTIADTVKSEGGRLVGVSSEHFRDIIKEDVDEKIVEKTIGERKATMLLKSDAVVALVGGIGTLDELTDVIELRRHGYHNKPIVILNTGNFYEGLKVQLQKMKDDGFISQKLDDLLYFADTPEDAITYINRELSPED